MVGVFRRSLSFPNKLPHRPSRPPISHHNRSISLPCSRSLPLISNLKTEIAALKIFLSTHPHNRTSACLCDALARLSEIHHSLHDILHLPQTQDSLRRHHKFSEHLLEDFLRFVDVYGIFQPLVLQLKEHQLAALIAIRKKDDSKIPLYIKSRKKLAKEMAKLVSTVRCIGQKCSGLASDSLSPTYMDDADVVSAVGDVVEVTVAVSVALFDGISASLAGRKLSWMGLRMPKKAKRDRVEEGIQEFQQVAGQKLWGLGKKGGEEGRMVLKRMQELEGCICGIEGGGEKVFRGLINTRVLLLNSLTVQ